MKTLIAIIALAVAAPTPSQPRHVCIAVPQAVYDGNRAKITQLCDRIWEQGQNAQPDSGWITIERVSNTNVTAMLYVVTEDQIRKQLTAAEVARLREILDGTGVLMMRW